MPHRKERAGLDNTPNLSITLLLSLLIALSVLGQQQQPGEAQPLGSKKVERSLKSGETHAYRLRLKAGQYLHVDVNQRGIDVVLSLADSSGQLIVERDRPNGASGPEALSFIAGKSGDYLLKVKALEEKGSSGQYEIESLVAAKPSAPDLKRVEAENLFQGGKELQKLKTITAIGQACAKYEPASVLWREIGDKQAEAVTQLMVGDCSQLTKADDKAIAAYERALILYRELHDPANEALTLTRLCVLNALLQKLESSFKEYHLATSIFHSLNDAEGKKVLDVQLDAAAESYLQLGLILYQQGSAERYETELALFGVARVIYREMGNDGKEALSLLSSGRVSSLLGKKQVALNYYDGALPLFRKANNKGGEATTLNNIGRIYSETGNKKKALDYYERQALPLFEEIRDESGQATTFNNIGRVYDDLGENRKALDYYENRALPLFQSSKDREGQATTFNNIGRVYSKLGEKRKALFYYEERALPLRRDTKDRSGEAVTLNNIGSVYFDIGERQKALSYFRDMALPLYKAIGNKSGEANTLNNMGRVYDDLGDRRKALDYYENQALPLFRAVADASGEATTLLNIGGLYASTDKLKALRYYTQEALPIYQKIGDRAGEATTLNNIGVIYSSMGQKQKALDYFEKQVMPIRTEYGDKAGAAATLNNIGGVYRDLGEKRKALDYYDKQSLPLYREIGDKSGEATTLNNIGSVYADLGEKQKALNYYEKQALPLVIALESRSGMATTLNNIGYAYSELGEKHAALEFYEKRALPLFRSVGDKSGEATTLNNIGSVYAVLGERQKALEYYAQTMSLYTAVRDGAGEARTLSNMMVIWNDLKRPRLAIFYGKRCVNVYQRVRSQNQDVEKEFQKTFLKSLEDFYRYLADLLIEQGRVAEAIQVLSAFKDQRYFDINPETTSKPEPLRLTQRETTYDARYSAAFEKAGELIRQVEEYRLTANEQTAGREEIPKLQPLESALQAALEQSLKTMKEGETEFSLPSDAGDSEPKIDEKREMQATLEELNRSSEKRSVAVYTVIGENKLRRVIVTQDEVIEVSSPIKGDRLNSMAKQLWALLQSDEYDPRTLSKELYDIVFKPITDKLAAANKLEKVLPQGTTIIWSLDGNLRYLPMAALYDGQKYMVERYNNVVFTRADSEQWNSKVSKRWTGVGFGSSRATTVAQYPYEFSALPNAVRELQAVLKTNGSPEGIFSGDIFPDAHFTRDAMIAALKQRRPLVHISSHFYFSPGNEARSFLLLGDGKMFPLSEMKQQRNLFGGVELLTLSACETAAQWADADGREVDGFAELAQRLGARAVLATLWSVSDDSSYWLMGDFYKRRQQDGGRRWKSESLREAQVALLRGIANVVPSASGQTTKRRGRNSTAIKILPAGKEAPLQNEEGVVYVEAKYAKSNTLVKGRPYAHPYFWSPFVLFGNWR